MQPQISSLEAEVSYIYPAEEVNTAESCSILMSLFWNGRSLFQSMMDDAGSRNTTVSSQISLKYKALRCKRVFRPPAAVSRSCGMPPNVRQISAAKIGLST
jgi:hypothetical protein